MLKRLLPLLLFFFAPHVYGEVNSAEPRLRVSLLTCSPGYNEVYEAFGHTAVRIYDSTSKNDVVFNYGMFDGFQKNFELKFMKGDVRYCVDASEFREFMMEYVHARRGVYEQEIVVNDSLKREIVAFLEWNALSQNKYYKYDFFYDNCSTRLRDLLPHILGGAFTYGKALPPVAHYTFRDVINEYLVYTPWERFGINILLGSRIDKVMTDKDIMFLPDYLLKGLDGAMFNGAKVAKPSVELLPAAAPPATSLNIVFMVMVLVMTLTILGITVPKLNLLGKIMSKMLLLVTGLLGCLILTMWFATSHGGCRDNFNILWALPTNLLLVFARPKGRAAYSKIAIIGIVAVFILHIFKLQQIPLLEFTPLLVSLIFVFGKIYREGQLETAKS